MSRTFLAIDIGRHGAAALLSDVGELLSVDDLPVLLDGPSYRGAVNGPLFAALVRRLAPGRAFVEFVAARPSDGPVGAFAFGRARGVIEGVLAAEGVPVDFLTPPTWKRAIGIPPGRDKKDAARSEAIRRWPRMAERFARVGDHDRAEAALIGVAGLMRCRLSAQDRRATYGRR